MDGQEERVNQTETIQEHPAEPIRDAQAEPTGEIPAAPADGKNKKDKKKEKKPLGQEILEWVVTILVAVIAALVIRSLVFEPVRVDGASMNDTLANGEIMFVSKWEYASTWLSMPWQSDEEKESAARFTTGFGSPERFDVVITRYPGRGDTNFVKRIVGLPGDRVKIEDGSLYVNGEKYEEPYINDDYRVSGGSNGQTFSEVYVPKKGDALSLAYGDESQQWIELLVNGEAWGWRGISTDAVAADGDRLTYRRDGTLLLNGEDISGDEEQLRALVGKEFSLEKDLYFVMGDHRNNSNDSRAQGPVSRDMLIGHVRLVLFPFGSIRGVE